jgi:hypothetical protein
VDCDRIGGTHQHHFRQLRLHQFSESNAYQDSTCCAMLERQIWLPVGSCQQ